MFVQLAVFQKGTFLITIRLCEGATSLIGGIFLFELLFAALMQVFCRGWIDLAWF